MEIIISKIKDGDGYKYNKITDLKEFIQKSEGRNPKLIRDLECLKDNINYVLLVICHTKQHSAKNIFYSNDWKK